jgi:hypothetical protein
MMRGTLLFVWLAFASGAVSGHAQTATPSGGTQFVFTADAHYGLARATFRGERGVSAHVVNAALVAGINRIAGLRIPDDGGVGAGRMVGPIDFVVEGGDIANRSEKGVQPAAASWKEFAEDYVDGLATRDPAGRRSALFVIPGNHDAVNAVGFHTPLTPEHDATSMAAIYNLMIAPSPPRTNETFDYRRDRVHFSRNVGALHLVFVHLWPDSAERAWLERDLRSVPPGRAVLLFAHDPPVADPRHFMSRGGDDVSAPGYFENLLSEPLKDRYADGWQTIVEQRELVAFLKHHPNVRAWFHGHVNSSDGYTWRGPDGDLALPVVPADSPMKGKLSAMDETKLSFEFVTIDAEANRMTVREVLYNATQGAPDSLPRWGTSTTVALR